MDSSRTEASIRFPDPAVQPTMPAEEAFRWLGLGRSAGFAAIARGDLPVLRIGRRVLVRTAALRRMLELDGATEQAS